MVGVVTMVIEESIMVPMVVQVTIIEGTNMEDMEVMVAMVVDPPVISMQQGVEVV